MVLQLRDDDFVTRFQKALAAAEGDKIDGFGRAAGEDDLIAALRVQYLRRLCARLFEDVCRFLTEAMHTAMHVRVALLHNCRHRRDDLPGLLRTGGAVEIDQRPPVNLALKNGEICS